MAQNSFLNQLKYQYQHGGMHIRLIAWNLGVFMLIQIGMLLASNSLEMSYWLHRIFALQSNGWAFITSPWGIFTSIFSHFSFMHFLFNMLFLYFTGQMFLQFFSGKRLFYTYLFGGITGGLVQILIGFSPDIFGENGALVVGASGSIMAIFIALAVYRPKLKVHLFGVFPLPLFVLAIFFVVKDFTEIGSNDGIAHFVHLGGALFGFLSVRNYPASTNILTRLIVLSENSLGWVNSKFTGRRLNKIQGRKPAAKSTDEEFNETKKMTQEEIDAILDKISRSGYDSLTKLEKEFLFKQSRK